MSSNWKAHLALFGASLIYGLNYTLAKDVMPDYVQPLGFIVLRVVGALVLFWALHSSVSKERIARKDFVRLFFCGLFGVAGNQLFFFAGLNLTTPINAAIIMTSNPVVVLVISAIILRERISWLKMGGIGLGLIGALILILSKDHSGFGTDTRLGDLFILINSISYGTYLVVVKPLMRKYEPLTVIKWVFTFGVLIVLPIGFPQFNEIEWSTLPSHIWWGIGYVVICTTFLAYLFNIYALKKVNPSVVSIYIYLQPLLSAMFALWRGVDTIDLTKIVSTALIFGGVYLVSRK